MMEYRNARWSSADQTMIDAEMNHPSFGWIPTTLTPRDPVTAEAFREIASGEVADFTPATNETIPSLTFLQLIIGLVHLEWITEAEGNAWFLHGELPPAAEAVVQAMPEDLQFAARIRATRPSSVMRDDPLVNAMAQAEGKTADEMDDFFRLSSTL